MRRASILVGGIGLLVSSACGATSSSSDNSGGTSSGGSSASGGSGAIGLAGTSNAGSGGGGPICAGDSYTGQLIPLDMYVMLDRSGSMGSNGAWSGVTTAFKNFVSLPGLEGLGMGLGYFPNVPNPPPPPTCAVNEDCGPGFICFFGICEQLVDSCEPTDYAKPIVPIAPLPGVGGAITTAIGNTSPGGGTPTTPALQGAMMYTIAWAANHPDHITAVVLATDGEPTGCSPNSISDVSSWAAKGLASTPSVRTFVVGIGDLAALNAVAQAGGTDQAIIISTGNAANDFLDALNKIRGAIGCSYKIPVPKDGGEADTGKVNVGFTPDGSTTEEPFGGVSGAEECKGKKAWYYNADKTQIVLCPAACDLVTNQKGKVDVKLGCPTQPPA